METSSERGLTPMEEAVLEALGKPPAKLAPFVGTWNLTSWESAQSVLCRVDKEPFGEVDYWGLVEKVEMVLAGLYSRGLIQRKDFPDGIRYARKAGE